MLTTLLALLLVTQYSEIGGANLDAAGSIAGTIAMGSYNQPHKRLTPAQQRVVVRTCKYQLPGFKKQYGTRNPQVRQLTRMCAAQGY